MLPLLPVELWHKIFLNTYPGDEFAIKPEQQFLACSLNNHKTVQQPVIREVFNDRASIVLTCRTWYHVGMPILYSHLGIQYRSYKFYDNHSYSECMESLLDFLVRNPFYCQTVRRITIEDNIIVGYKRNLDPILKLCPNLQVIGNLSEVEFRSCLPSSAILANVILNSFYSFAELETTSSFLNLKYIRLTLLTHSQEGAPLHLPVLEAATFDVSGPVFLHPSIVSLWTFPRLQKLEIRARVFDIPPLIKPFQSITTLIIWLIGPSLGLIPEHVALPHLVHLCMSVHDETVTLISFVLHTPRLTTLELSGPKTLLNDYPSDKVMYILDTISSVIQDQYPKLLSIILEKSLVFDLPHEFLSEWEGKLLKLKVNLLLTNMDQSVA